MIDLKHEMERELSLIDRPDLWDRIEAAASDDDGTVVLDLASVRRRRRPSLWLAVAAAAACLAVAALVTDGLSDRKAIDATDPSTSATPSTADGGEEPIVLVTKMRFIDGPLAGGTLDLDADGEDEDVTGSLEFHGIHARMVIALDCVDSDTETGDYALLALGGQVTTPAADGAYDMGDRLFFVVRPGVRDRTDGYPGGGSEGFYSVKIAEGDAGESCDELVDSAAEDLVTDESGWSSTGVPRDEVCSVVGDLGVPVEIDIEESRGETLDAFGLRWIPIGRMGPPEGPAVATLTDTDRLKVTSEFGAAYFFEPAPCG